MYFCHDSDVATILTDEKGLFYPDNGVDFMETWSQFEKLYHRGIVKAIGVSNFNVEQLERLLRECLVKPAVNQIESHPHFNNEDLIRFCEENHIHVTGECALRTAQVTRHMSQPVTPVR